MIYFYARVSAKDQKLDRQLAAAREKIPELDEKCVFCDKKSGKDFDRPEYSKMISMLTTGDVLVVKSIDRFGRNYKEIQEQWRLITKELMADIVVLDMPLLDTRIKNDLTGTLIADIVLQVLSYVAETERLSIQQRREEGMALARERGVKFGRPKKSVKGFQEIFQKTKKGLVTVNEACRELGISRTQWYRMAKKEQDTADLWPDGRCPAGSALKESADTRIVSCAQRNIKKGFEA